MRATVGRIFYCCLLNSKSLLICIVGKQQKIHKPRSLNYCFIANQRVLFFAMPFLPYKGFALMGHLKTAMCECLRSRANRQVRIFLNIRLQHLLAVENKVILEQLQLSTLYMIKLFFYPHHTGIRSEMLYLNGGSKSAKNECLRNSIEKTSEAFTCCRTKYLYSSKNSQIVTCYVLTQ